MKKSHEELTLCMRKFSGKEFTINNIHSQAVKFDIKLSKATIRGRIERLVEYGVVKQFETTQENRYFMSKPQFNRLCGWHEEYKAIRKARMKVGSEKANATKALMKNERVSKTPKLSWGSRFKGAPGDTIQMRSVCL